MNLEKFCRGRLVVLRPSSTAYDAARAMRANHVGAVLVADRKGLAGIVTDRDLALNVVGNHVASRIMLSQVMTPDPVTLDAGDAVEKAAALMHAMHVRRIVVLEGRHPKGLVTLDDLILARAVPQSRVRDVVFGQLSDWAPSKPEGFTRPARVSRRASGSTRRSQARRRQTLQAFLRRVRQVTGLSSDADARAAFEVVLGALLQRLTPSEAKDLLAQLPSLDRARLLRAARSGPDRSITRESIVRRTAARLKIPPQRAAEVVSRLGHSLGDFVSEGELADVKGQLPAALKPLLDRAA
jgi:CBS domain-containing protein/uncharacterized protein (DUF2267 family)